MLAHSRRVCNDNICQITYAVKRVYTAKLWGKCHPSDCYWGKLDGVYTSSNWLRFYYDQGFAKRTQLGFALSAGLMGGFTNVMSPLLIIYALEARFSKPDTIQAVNLCFLLGKSVQLLLFSLYGEFTLSTLADSSLLLLVVVLALYLGILVKQKINATLYKKLLRGLLLILALMLLFKVAI